MIVSIDLLGPKGMILSTAQQFSEDQMDPYKLFPDFCLVKWYKKKRPKSFLHWEDCLFSQKFVFSTTSQVLKKRSYKLDSNCQISLWTIVN